MHDLGTLGGSSSDAYGSNAAGWIVGSAMTRYDWARRAFFRRDGPLQDLGTLGGSDSEARAINDLGQIVGWAHVTSGTEHAFLYRDGTMLDLDPMGLDASRAYGINSAGEVVGDVDDARGGVRAFHFDGRVMRDLNTLIPAGSGWILTAAYAINDRGQIAGMGRLRGRGRAFLLTPERVTVRAAYGPTPSTHGD